MAIMNTVISGGGSTPTGTKYITSNGTHDVAGYANADVQVPTTAPAHYIEKTVDANGKLINSTNIINLNGVTDVGDYALYYSYRGVSFSSNTSVDLSSLTTVSGSNACHSTFQGCTGITSVNLSSLTTVSGYYACNTMFQSCTNLTSVDLSGLTTVNGSNACDAMFYQCTGITSVDLSSLIAISNNYACSSMFQGCTGLTSVDLSSLTTISGGSRSTREMFGNCTGLTSVNLSSLTKDDSANEGYVFSGCTSLQTLSFPSWSSGDSFFWQMLQGVTGCTVHFPSNMSSMSSLTPSTLGGTNTTVLFDLPATNTLTGADSITYTRNPKYDTATALAWKVGAYGTTNFTPAYYTSGTTDPVVSDTIYSDAACTTVVTTISSIA